jgi:hypothetical protein
MRVRMISAIPPFGGGQAEHAIGRRHQAPGKVDTFALVGVQQTVRRATGQNGCKFPGEIDGVADAGVHALAAGRAMDMRGVAEQESATLTEVLRHPMMDVISREPIHLIDRTLRFSIARLRTSSNLSISA